MPPDLLFTMIPRGWRLCRSWGDSRLVQVSRGGNRTRGRWGLGGRDLGVSGSGFRESRLSRRDGASGGTGTEVFYRHLIGG